MELDRPVSALGNCFYDTCIKNLKRIESQTKYCQYSDLNESRLREAMCKFFKVYMECEDNVNNAKDVIMHSKMDEHDEKIFNKHDPFEIRMAKWLENQKVDRNWADTVAIQMMSCSSHR